MDLIDTIGIGDIWSVMDEEMTNREWRGADKERKTPYLRVSPERALEKGCCNDETQRIIHMHSILYSAYLLFQTLFKATCLVGVNMFISLDVQTLSKSNA
jgi:hypothetical protein